MLNPAKDLPPGRFFFARWSAGCAGAPAPRNGQGSLKDVESALDELLSSQGERSPLPLPLAVRAELFPGVTFRTRTRRDSHAALKQHKAQRQEDNRLAREALLHQAQVGQARIDLSFQSPETVGAWYARWGDELDERELAGLAQDGETTWTVITDFLADMMHLCAELGIITPDKNLLPDLLEGAEFHFTAEDKDE